LKAALVWDYKRRFLVKPGMTDREREE